VHRQDVGPLRPWRDPTYDSKIGRSREGVHAPTAKQESPWTPASAPLRRSAWKAIMTEPALWTLSIQAFSAVIVVLALLAGAVRLLTLVFQAPPPAPVATPAAPPGASPGASSGTAPADDAGGSDAFVLAAIHAAVQRAHPGARVTRVDEVRSDVR